jgi:hypothetical protein
MNEGMKQYHLSSDYSHVAFLEFPFCLNIELGNNNI